MEVKSEQLKRDRRQRTDRHSRFSEDRAEPSRGHRNKENQIYVSNIPYDYDWKDVKDLFREHVGDVSFVQLFNDDNDKPRGCGIVEFPNVDLAKKAIAVMHRFIIQGRKLVIKEDSGQERDDRGYIVKGVRDDKPTTRSSKSSQGFEAEDFKSCNTYGLSAQFLESIGVSGPLHNKVFVANLDYKVDKAKLKEVFKMAGKLRNVDLSIDKEGNSRGFAIIEYDHPVEAVQAISMFDHQYLYERKLTVRMDRVNADKTEVRLPDGLKAIGIGLGPNGEPLRDVAQNILQSSMGVQQSNINPNSMNMNPANISLNNLSVPNMNNANLLTGNLGLQNYNLASIGNIQNQLQRGDLGTNSIRPAMKNNTMLLGLGRNNQSSLNSRFQNGSNNFIGNQPTLNIDKQPQNELYGNFPRNTSIKNIDQQPRNDPYGNFQRNSNMENINKKPMDTIRVLNLPPSLNWQLLREKFSEAGEIKFADKIDEETSIIQYYDEIAAARAIEMFDMTRIDRRSIEVRYH